jgi:DNA-binding beta-propeller fold protein YncE
LSPDSTTLQKYPILKTITRFRRVLLVSVLLAAAACSSNPVDQRPPTIAPAGPAVSPPLTTAPAGQVRPLPVKAQAAVFDAATASLVVLSTDGITIIPETDGQTRTITLPGPATALTGDGRGVAYLSTRGGYLSIDVRTGSVTPRRVAGHENTQFTAIARRSDSRLVLGSADGAVYTLGSDAAVAAEVKIFARVDALATQENTAVVLDRGQTSVTTLDPDGTHARHALRAGEGATTLAADPMGRVLVADTRGGELLVFGTDPLMMRQRYPVPDAPYGTVGTRTLAWVSLTATNLVVGYDLATGIPVEKMRYPTVRQPDVLAFDDATYTLYVASASGDGIQVINNAGRPR